jgi:hypothetical protein
MCNGKPCKNTTICEEDYTRGTTKVTVYCCECGEVIEVKYVANGKAEKDYDKDS